VCRRVADSVVMDRADDGTLTMFLCGDVMLGRGVDQILPHPGDPELRESLLHDAGAYVALAEAANGPIPRPVEYSWPWGDALALLDELAPALRVINLETSATRRGRFAPGKGVHYRMSPANVPALSVARPDVCALANNHVLDFGRDGLLDTLDTLTSAGIRAAGAGRDRRAAWQPAVVDGAGCDVAVLSFAMVSSGVPSNWAATDHEPGVALLRTPSDAERATSTVRARKQQGDVVVVSVHWGSNWGYDVDPEHIRIAHGLIDSGADLVHGHSSHHPRPIEVYRDRLILYGCGDFIDDYEGITGYEHYRDDLRLAYFASLHRETGALAGLRIAPLQAHRMRLRPASTPDRAWLQVTLDSVSHELGTQIELDHDGMLSMHW
jgi:poly-gamma-glutamate capsule biosynthesis protein CapA/YwtB (metallophosphatase superfamily)